MGRIEIGLTLVGDDISSALGIRTIIAIFHGQLSGQPAVLLRLKKTRRYILSAICFNTLADTPSIPVDLEISRAKAAYSSAIRTDSEQLVNVLGG